MPALNHKRTVSMEIQATEVLEDFFFIERGYLNANHFVYRGEPPVLIDTAYITDFAETAGIINGLGVRLSDISRIITTHCHCDHIGGNKLIHKESGCEIWLHELGRQFIASKDAWSTWWSYYNQKAEFFPCSGSLQDGDVIDIGPHRFEVLHTPGHAADGLVLYNRKNKLLLSSDTLWENDIAVHTVRIEGSAAVYNTQRSLERLGRLEVDRVCPGHGRLFADFNSALTRSLARADAYIADRTLVGADVLKKITVYTLLMQKSVAADAFYELLMDTHWYKETVDLYFNGDYEGKYIEVVDGFIKKGIIQRRGGMLVTTVKP
jgi:glyoxylase-like metal-dependent hydrolase (beta-lactamase superfamily II)